MDFRIASDSPTKLDTGLLAMIVDDPDIARTRLRELDELLSGAVSRAFDRGHLRHGKPDTTVLSGAAEGPHRVVLIGPASEGDRAEALRNAGARAAATARSLRAHDISIAFAQTPAGAEAALVAEGCVLGAYRYERFKSGTNDDSDEASVPELSLTMVGVDGDAGHAVQRAVTIARATNWARDLANAPGNHMTPELLADEALRMAQRHEHLSVRVLDKAAIAEHGMGLVLSVAQGSVNEPRVIVLEWNPPAADTADEERIALVGKAVTFDTGGISIKPSAGMPDMKMDKSGGCAVLGAMRAIAELELPQRVLAVVGAAENMPGSNAYKPGDVITAMDGTTIEVTNTDAEGRLVLGDSISLARSLGCGRIAEASTLTGAMVIALGHYFAGCIADDGEWTEEVLAAARRSGDHSWHLPMHDHYRGALKSDCADMVNSGGRAGGSLYAGLFLKHFAKDTPFVHLDVAGTAMLDKPRDYYSVKGASGFGVRLFTDLVANR